MESICQYLNQLTEVYTLVGNIIENSLVAVSLIFHITDFHVEIQVECNLSGAYHGAMFASFGFIIFVHIYLFGFTVDTLDISLRLDVRFSHLQRNKTSG